MDLVRKVSASLGTIITTVNEEELMEEALEIVSSLPVKQIAEWLRKGVEVLPDDVTLMDLILEDEKYDEILDEALNIEDLFTPEQLTELKEKFGQKEGEPE